MQFTYQPPVVTQEQLRELKRLREANGALQSLREEIRDALGAGAPIEPGPLSARLEDVHQHRFSAAALKSVFGAAWVKATGPKLPVSTSRRIHLICSDAAVDSTSARNTNIGRAGNHAPFKGKAMYRAPQFANLRDDSRLD
jgi:hypothetical protein